MSCPEQLKKAALQARTLLYSPYSKFRVGAAVLTADDKIIVGANVENASYPASICAERVAFPRALMDGHSEFKAIAIAGDGADPILPCGVCRQFMYEFAPDLAVFMVGGDGDVVTMTLGELLPRGFGPSQLQGK